MNPDNFRRLADVIEEADRFDMSTWCKTPGNQNAGLSDVARYDILHTCNTTACVGGWTAAVMIDENPELKNLGEYDMNRAVERWLGMEDPCEVNNLFYWSGGSVWQRVRFRDSDFAWEDSNEYDDESEYYPKYVAWYEKITAAQAAAVLREIADGELQLNP